MCFNTKFPESMRITMPVTYMCTCCPTHNCQNHAFDLAILTVSFKMGAHLFIWAGSAQVYGRFYNK